MKLKVYLLLLLIIISFCLRIVYIKADPPSLVASISRSASIYCDEGMYPHNARNKILFGKWVTDDWNPFIYNPILTFLYYIFFLLLGVKITVVKIINILFVVFIIFLYYMIVSNKVNHFLSFALSVLFSMNLYWIVYSRVGILENFSTLSFIITFYFFSELDKKENKSFWVGVFSAISILSKYLFFYYIIVTFLSVLYKSIMKKSKKIFVNFVIGSLLTFLLWLILVYLPNVYYFNKIGNAWGKQSIPRGFKKAFLNLIHNYLPRYFAISPLIFLSGIIFISFIIVKFIFRKRVGAEEFFIFLWISFAFAQIGILNYQPLRYYLPLIPALFIAFALFIKNLEKFKFDAKKYILLIILNLLILVIFFKSFIPNLLKPPSAFFIYPVILRILFLMSVIILFLIPILNRKKNIFINHIIILIFLSESFLFLNIILKPTYNLNTISNYISRMDQNSFIAGQCALRTAFNSKIKAIPAYKGWFNDTNLFEKYPITNLLMLKKFHEIFWIERKYPFIKNRINLIKEFPIWNTKLDLYRIVKKEEK